MEDGKYYFDSNVPDYVQEATYRADGSWGTNYHDPNNASGTLITIVDLNVLFNLPTGPNVPHDIYGAYDSANNVLMVDSYYINECSTACNRITSTIAHEFGHSVGMGHTGPGCESSLMSWARDRDTVISPSSEDLCWWENWYYGDGGDPCPTCFDQKLDKKNPKGGLPGVPAPTVPRGGGGSAGVSAEAIASYASDRGRS